MACVARRAVFAPRLGAALARTRPPGPRTTLAAPAAQARHLSRRSSCTAEKPAALATAASDAVAVPPCPLRAAAQGGRFQHAVAVPGGFRAGPMALDPDGNRLFVADGNQVLVQDLADRTRPPVRLSLGPTVRLQVELGEGQDLRFACKLVRDGALSDRRRDSYTHRMEQGFRTGFHVWLPGTDSAPRFFGPEELDEIENLLAATEDGEAVAVGGRLFGDHVGKNAKSGLDVACDDRDNWLGWPWAVVKTTGKYADVNMQPWAGYTAREFHCHLSRLRTAQPNARIRRLLQSLGAPASVLDAARHGDAIMLVAVKGRPDVAKAAHLAAERGAVGFKECGPAEKLAGVEWRLCQHGLVTGLAYDWRRKTLLVATANHLLEWDTVADTMSRKKVDGPWAQRTGGIAFDHDRGQLYFRSDEGVHCLDVCSAAGDASLPVAGFQLAPQSVSDVMQHREWLFLTHAAGVAVVDQGRDLQMDIARCKGAVASAIVHDRVAIIFEHDVRLAAWSIADIGARLAQVAAGGGFEQPPPPAPWLGLGSAGFPTPGLPPQKTALAGIAGVLEHRGEVFVAHHRGVFSVPLTTPPLRVTPERRADVEACHGLPDQFAVAVPAPACQDATAEADAPPPFQLAGITHGPGAPLLMSPVLRPAKGARWVMAVPLRVPRAPLVCGLAPMDDILANADLLPPEERPRKPRVDGVLIHQPDPYDESSRAVRLHEVVAEEGGKSAWSVGADLWRRLQEKIGMADERRRPFFMGDSDGNMVIELEGSCRPNDRGGIVYRLEGARLRGLGREPELDIDLIGEPLEEFVIGRSRPVRFYVCTLGPAASGPEPPDGRGGEGDGGGGGATSSPASAPRVCLEWVPEHVPSMQLRLDAKA